MRLGGLVSCLFLFAVAAVTDDREQLSGPMHS